MIEIKRSTVTVTVEDAGGDYPFGVTKKRSGLSTNYVTVEDFELEPYTIDLISRCGKFRVIKG